MDRGRVLPARAFKAPQCARAAQAAGRSAAAQEEYANVAHDSVRKSAVCRQFQPGSVRREVQSAPRPPTVEIELVRKTVTSRVKDPSAMRLDQRVDSAAEFAKRSMRAGLIFAHKPAITDTFVRESL
jgi:hypothetical protein